MYYLLLRSDDDHKLVFSMKHEVQYDDHDDKDDHIVYENHIDPFYQGDGFPIYPGYDHGGLGYGKSGFGGQGYGNRRVGGPGFGGPEYGKSGFGGPGYDKFGLSGPGYGNHRNGGPGYDKSGISGPGYGKSDYGGPGYGKPVFGGHGYRKPGYGGPGYGNHVGPIFRKRFYYFNFFFSCFGILFNFPIFNVTKI